MKLPVIILGAGGHASVVADALLLHGVEVIGFADRDKLKHGKHVCGLRVLGDDRQALLSYQLNKLTLANGIGGVRGTELRRTVQIRHESFGWHFTTVRHPSAIVSPRATIEEGVQVLAVSVVQVGAVIGKGSIVNTSAIVEHDCTVGEFVHVAPRALLCAHVTVGANSHIGAGAVVKQGVRLGPNTIVGAGAVVIKDFAGNGILLGVPARQFEPRS